MTLCSVASDLIWSDLIGNVGGSGRASRVAWCKRRLNSLFNPLPDTQPHSTLQRVAEELFAETGISLSNEKLSRIFSQCKVDDDGWQGSVFDIETPPSVNRIINPLHQRWDRFVPMPVYWEDQFIGLLTAELAKAESNLAFLGHTDDPGDD